MSQLRLQSQSEALPALRGHGLQQGPDVVHRLRVGDENRIGGFPRHLVIVMVTVNAAFGQTLMRAQIGFSKATVHCSFGAQLHNGIQPLPPEIPCSTDLG